MLDKLHRYGNRGAMPVVRDLHQVIFWILRFFVLNNSREGVAVHIECPRFVLRFLHLFGMDNSIVRVRNRVLAGILVRITKGYLIFDYKTKWHSYDLRISIYGDEQMQDLATSIEDRLYDVGYREDLADQIRTLNPGTKYTKSSSVGTLKEELNRLEKRYDGHNENIKDFICD